MKPIPIIIFMLWIVLLAGMAWGQNYTSVMDSSLTYVLPDLIKDGLYEFKCGKFTAVDRITTMQNMGIAHSTGEPSTHIQNFKIDGDGYYVIKVRYDSVYCSIPYCRGRAALSG